MQAVDSPPFLTSFELHLHGEGTHYESYRSLGAHLLSADGVDGVRFAVWAPNAEQVMLTGDFNGWNHTSHPMSHRSGGVWEAFIPGLGQGAHYKYVVKSRSGHVQEKCDPYAFFAEVPPRTASIVWSLNNYTWGDSAWMERRGHRNMLREPVSIYEVHLESWLRGAAGEWLGYREVAHKLSEYVMRMGYTHIELMPVMEHPFSGSWGYQVTGYYAPTSRFGTPDDFRYFVDHLHQHGIGVILDWVPAHFPRDAHGLRRFDGTAVYEHEDPRIGEHREWGTMVFNYGRNEVRTFLLSNALYWLREFHADGLRVDAVASMLYLDYSRNEGEWIPNRFGGRENLEAIDFIKRFNELVHREPGAISIAEESTAWAGVSRPVYTGGLGFTMKWNMGWMHDMFEYFSKEPVYRKYHQQQHHLQHAVRVHRELPVAGVARRSGARQKRAGFARCRATNGSASPTRARSSAYMFAHPGKKLMFMGTEFGQTSEWNHTTAPALVAAAVPGPLHATDAGARSSTRSTGASPRFTKWTTSTRASSGSTSRTRNPP